MRVQREYLRRVAKSLGDDPEFLRKLSVIEDPDVAEDVREEAEKEVMAAVEKFGVWIGHGDLLTVKMVQEARSLMKGSATLFERLGFLGPFRLQLLHMKMKKIGQDYSACMPTENNFEDYLTISWSSFLTRIRVSNKSKQIKKNDSSFELHDQFIAAVQSSYLVNMYDNFTAMNPKVLQDIHSLEDVNKFILEMLDYFGVQLYYDPNRESSEDTEDDLFVYCQVS